MNNFLEIALGCLAKGWHVHPLKPGNKIPITSHGKSDATTNEEQIRAWWSQVPNANIGISCGTSGLAVLDIDNGLTDLDGFNAWRIAARLPETYTVRTGRRPGFGVQMYFSGAIPDIGLWELNGCSGQVKSAGGLVLAAGCLHPSGEYYVTICDAPIQPTPDAVRKLQKPRSDVKPGEPIKKLHAGEGRRPLLMKHLGSLFNTGLSRDGLLSALVDLNECHCADLVPLEVLESMVDGNLARWDPPQPEGAVSFGKSEKKISDWHELFHSTEETLNAPPISFLIKDFLQCEGVTGLGAPAGARKSLIALNVAWALATGEKLFDYFEVVKKPERILYLCPESSLGPFVDRLKKIGLLPYVNKTLFYRTMSAEGHMELDDPALKTALPGSVVILDTAIRFLQGNEKESEDVRVFADTLFTLLRNGAEAVLMLHHSAKGSDKFNTLTLESIMRGSGDMGAFLASCWGTRLQNPEEPYQSASYLKNVKPRDFESEPFEVTSGADCRLHIVGEPGKHVVISNKSSDDNDAVAELFIREHLHLSTHKIEKLFKEQGISTKRRTWIGKVQTRLREEAYAAIQANGGNLTAR